MVAAIGGSRDFADFSRWEWIDKMTMTAVQTTKDDAPEVEILVNAVIERCADMFVPVSLVDPASPDLPLVYVNRAFEDLTGYAHDDVVGRNCRFLQGAATSAEDVSALRQAVRAEEPISKVLLNYRRDGTPFYNLLSVSPISISFGQNLLLGCQARFDEYPLMPDDAGDETPAPLTSQQAKALRLQYRALQQRAETTAMFVRCHLVSSRLIWRI